MEVISAVKLKSQAKWWHRYHCKTVCWLRKVQPAGYQPDTPQSTSIAQPPWATFSQTIKSSISIKAAGRPATTPTWRRYWWQWSTAVQSVTKRWVKEKMITKNFGDKSQILDIRVKYVSISITKDGSSEIFFSLPAHQSFPVKIKVRHRNGSS